jgi:hypothetical protein
MSIPIKYAMLKSEIPQIKNFNSTKIIRNLSKSKNLFQQKLTSITAKREDIKISNTKLSKRVYEILNTIRSENEYKYGKDNLFRNNIITRLSNQQSSSNLYEEKFSSQIERRKFIDLLISDKDIMKIINDEKFPRISYRNINN